jgi:hypothetical protein
MMMMMIVMMMMTMTTMIKRDQERSQKYFKTRRPYNTKNTFQVKGQNKSDTSTNRGNWNYLKITLKVPEQHTQEARNEGIGHFTHTSESTNVKVQKCLSRDKPLQAACIVTTEYL